MDGACRYVQIVKPRGWKLAKGQSISIDGICSTVVEHSQSVFAVEYMPETLSKTTASDFVRDRVVNLERSLKLGDRIEGHFVQGHVDHIGHVVDVRSRGTSRDIDVSVPRELRRYIAERGSITINGVALTVAGVRTNVLSVSLIPYTLSHTNLGGLKKNDTVNIETDMMARYVAALVESDRVPQHAAKKRSKKTAR